MEKRSVLIVDDQELNREILKEMVFNLGHQCLCAENGREALEIIREKGPDLVLLDIMMPEMDGFETLEIMRQDATMRDLPVVVISALDERDSVARCIELGADDYLTKPFDATLLTARVNACLEKKLWRDQSELYRRMLQDQNLYLEQRVKKQVQLIEEQTKQLSRAQLGTIFALSKLAEHRDEETGEHLERMREYCRVMARKVVGSQEYGMALDERFIDNIYIASPLHDIGKVGVPDAILRKPGKLTAEEFEVMKTHPVIGSEALRNVNRNHPGNAFLFMGIEIARSHHEKWDGSGYPDGLGGEAIPLPARILAVADVYDALTSERCYKKAFTHEKARSIIAEGRGAHFDPVMVDIFLHLEEEFLAIRRHFRDPEEPAVATGQG